MSSREIFAALANRERRERRSKLQSQQHMSKVKKIKLDSIRLDGGTQSRVAIDQSVVDEYAATIRENVAQLPPVTVFHDGQDHWLADGFHRIAALKSIGVKRVPADVRDGTLRDAILHSVGANSSHGLRRSNADKRRAVERLLSDDEWSRWSNREIAARCGVSTTLVDGIRRESLQTVCSDNRQQSRFYTTKQGGASQMDVSKIGKKNNAKIDPDDDGYYADEDDYRESSRPRRNPLEDPDLTDRDELWVACAHQLWLGGLDKDVADTTEGFPFRELRDLWPKILVAKQNEQWADLFLDEFNWPYPRGYEPESAEPISLPEPIESAGIPDAIEATASGAPSRAAQAAALKEMADSIERARTSALFGEPLISCNAAAYFGGDIARVSDAARNAIYDAAAMMTALADRLREEAKALGSEVAA